MASPELPDDWQAMDTTSDGKTLYYRRRVCYEMKWSGVNLDECLVAVGACGGPIALTRDPKKLVKDTTGQKQNFISVYKSSGQFIRRIETLSTCIVHSMAWTQDELLAVVYTDSVVQLFTLTGDAFAQENFKGTALNTSFYSNGVIVQTDKNVLKNVAFHPKRSNTSARVQITTFSEGLLDNLTQLPVSMHAFLQESEDEFDELEANVSCLFSPAPEDNLGETMYMLTQDDRKDMQTGPHLGQVLSASMSPNSSFMASFNKMGKINVTSKKAKVVSTFNTRSLEPPNQLLWCASDAVVAIWLPYQLTRNNNKQSLLVLIGPAGAHETYKYSGPIHAVTERDCVRIISNTSCDIIEKVPQSTADIFGIGSMDSSALLLEAFKEHQAEKTNSIQSIRQLEAQGLSDAVDALVDSAGHEWDTDRQKELLKAASYGKCFCKKYEAEFFLEQCKKLRVLNAVRAPDVGLPLTLAQYNFLTPRILVNRLIQRELYFLAYRVCTYLELKEKKEEVLVHWANTKILASTAETAGAVTDDDIVRSIQEKFSETPGIYRKVANTARLAKRKSLAIKLLEKEAKASDQVDLLIDMDENELALNKAINSGDTDLVYLVILKMKKQHTEEELISMLSNTGARDLFVAYCEHQNPGLLKKYFSHMNMHHRTAFRALKMYIEEPDADISTKNRYLKEAKDNFGRDKTKDRKLEIRLIEEQEKLLAKQRLYAQDKKDRAFCAPGLSVTGTLRLLIKHKEKDDEKLAKEFSLSHEMYHWAKLKALCEFGYWSELETFASSKKSALKKSIGFLPFVQECLRYKQTSEARKYVGNIEDYAQRCEAFCDLNMIKVRLPHPPRVFYAYPHRFDHTGRY